MYSYLISYCLGFIFSLIFLPESPEPLLNESKYITLVIEKDSYLKIQGSTNVNSFSCGYRGKISADTLRINMQWNEDMILLDDAALSVEVVRFDCGQSAMNKDFRSLLQHDEYPYLNLNIISLRLAPQAPYEAVAKVSIEIAGEEGVYEVPVRLEKGNGEQYYSGKQPVNIRDFGLTPPKKFLGMVVVDEEVVIDFMLNLKQL